MMFVCTTALEKKTKQKNTDERSLCMWKFYFCMLITGPQRDLSRISCGSFCSLSDGRTWRLGNEKMYYIFIYHISII